MKYAYKSVLVTFLVSVLLMLLIAVLVRNSLNEEDPTESAEVLGEVLIDTEMQMEMVGDDAYELNTKQDELTFEIKETGYWNVSLLFDIVSQMKTVEGEMKLCSESGNTVFTAPVTRGVGTQSNDFDVEKSINEWKAGGEIFLNEGVYYITYAFKNAGTCRGVMQVDVFKTETEIPSGVEFTTETEVMGSPYSE